MFITKQVTPKYIRIKVGGSNTQSKRTTIAATKFTINQDIKFLYCKLGAFVICFNILKYICAYICKNNIYIFI
jgi:hypothetical protein